jgi:hypothetical protein
VTEVVELSPGVPDGLEFFVRYLYLDPVTGARGRGLGLGEQLVEVAAQNPHAPANAQSGQRTRIFSGYL